MNTVVWAEMQDLDVLASVERMIPDLADENDFIERYTIGRYREVQELTKSSKVTGKQKVAVGISLVAAGTSALMLPGNAMAAAAIQRSFQLGGAFIGSFTGPQGAFVGFAVGTVVGGIVAAVWVYGVPVAQVVVGSYLIVSGISEML